ncbi:MAG: polysaccharide deacetylase family protein [Chloroflexi bacterium]|nr:polysaccharide deacetylase family protein [Chloroflexota bacterium]
MARHRRSRPDPILHLAAPFGHVSRALLALIPLVLLVVACTSSPPAEHRHVGPAPVEVEPTPTAAPTPLPTVAPTPAPTAPAVDYATVKPNELGKVLVVEYHAIGDEELRWTRTRANFRKDLERLYRRGYRLISMSDFLDNRIDVPAGTTPVILTFDDSNRSQFQIVQNPDDTLRPDTESGAGILESFIAQHPDFGRGALFCILPGADAPNDLFGQKERAAQSLHWLVDHGYELCNHTLWHANLATLSPAETVEQIAGAAKAVADLVPGYRMTVFNPPHGVYPDDLSPVISGSYGGITYKHRAILEVGGGPMYPPGHVRMDPFHITRVQSVGSLLEAKMDELDAPSGDRYISDGDPNVVVFPEAEAGNYRPIAGATALVSPRSGYRTIRLRPGTVEQASARSGWTSP